MATPAPIPDLEDATRRFLADSNAWAQDQAEAGNYGEPVEHDALEDRAWDLIRATRARERPDLADAIKKQAVELELIDPGQDEPDLETATRRFFAGCENWWHETDATDTQYRERQNQLEEEAWNLIHRAREAQRPDVEKQIMKLAVDLQLIDPDDDTGARGHARSGQGARRPEHPAGAAHTIRNATPHPVTIRSADGDLVVEPTHPPIRIEMREEERDPLRVRASTHETVVATVEQTPHADAVDAAARRVTALAGDDAVAVLVSGVVLDAFDPTRHADALKVAVAPDTGPQSACRDANHAITAVRRLRRGALLETAARAGEGLDEADIRLEAKAPRPTREATRERQTERG